MKNKVFTLVFAFLAMAGNAIWGQNGSVDHPETIDISFMRTDVGTVAPTGDGFIAIKGTTSGTSDSDQSNTLTITDGGYYKLTGGNSNIQIKVTATEPVHIILASGIHVDASLDNDLTNPLQDKTAGIWENRCAMEIASGANVTLDWEGDCELSSGGLRAGINVKPGATLILKGTNNGTLYGTCWNNQEGIYTCGAGIGGDSEDADFGTIIIESGTVVGRCYAQVSNWKAYGAGIGGGFKQGTPDPVDNGTSSTTGTIIIKGGDVTGTANYDNADLNIHTTGRSAAIGGGYKGTCTNIAILGGTINNNTATGNGADVIGVGEDYEDGITNGIIIGQWDESTTAPTINLSDINQTNYVDGRGEYPSVTGNVTMPDRTQMYVPNAPIIPSQKGNQFNVYNVTLLDGILGDENHKVIGTDATKKIANYYYGAYQSFTVKDLSCNEKHLFLGWFENASNMVSSNSGIATFTMPETTPTSPVNHIYSPVWVNNEYEITVKTGTSWVKDETKTPRITYSPDASGSDVLDELEFAFSTNPLPTELSGLTFDENQLTTTTPITLQNNETYKECEVKATVSFNKGATKEIKIVITVVDEIMINSITVATIDHVYNGQLHNGRGDINGDRVLDVKMTHDIEGNPLATETSLSESVHYRIYKYSFEGGTEQIASGTTESLPIKDAGTYSNITIQAIGDAVLTDENFLPIAEGTKNLGNATIKVAQRPINIDISLPTLEEGKTPTWADLKVDIEKPNNNKRGLVDGENISVSGDVAYQLNEEGTEATITITNIQIAKASENSDFKESNYDIRVNSNTYTDELTITITAPVSPKEDDNTNDNIHIDRPKKYYHIYIDTVCPGLQLELSKDSVIEGGQVSVYLTVEEKCDTTGFTFEYKRGLKKWWQDLKPLEGVQPGEYIIKNIYSDIYIQALDAILEIEEEPTGIEDMEGAKVYAKEGTIYVYTPNHERVMIVSMNGAIVKSAEQEGMQSYSLNRGIYIVRIGDKVFKIKN